VVFLIRYFCVIRAASSGSSRIWARIRLSPATNSGRVAVKRLRDCWSAVSRTSPSGSTTVMLSTVW
jgi:hypothetical protein